MSERIEVGDKVTVYFSSHPVLDGIVEYMPQATGDSWVLKAKKLGSLATYDQVTYIQQFAYMVKQ